MTDTKKVIGEYIPYSVWGQALPEHYQEEPSAPSVIQVAHRIIARAGDNPDLEGRIYPASLTEVCEMVIADGFKREMPDDLLRVRLLKDIRKPWEERYYAEVWREIANRAGIPENVCSMDMRAGGATEADGIEGITGPGVAGRGRLERPQDASSVSAREAA